MLIFTIVLSVIGLIIILVGLGLSIYNDDDKFLLWLVAAVLSFNILSARITIYRLNERHELKNQIIEKQEKLINIYENIYEINLDQFEKRLDSITTDLMLQKYSL